MNKRQGLALTLMSVPWLFGGCTSTEGPASAYEVKRTSMDQTAMGFKRGGAVGAIVQWDNNNATVDLNQLLVQVKIVARREASARQRSVARERATAAFQHLSPAAKLAMKERHVRYLAVETERDAQSRGRRSVMIWDTYSAAVVGHDVYDISDVPKVGVVVRFETYSATYIGTGAERLEEMSPVLPQVASGPR